MHTDTHTPTHNKGALHVLRAQIRELEQRAALLGRPGIAELCEVIEKYRLSDREIEAALEGVVATGIPRKRGVRKGTTLAPRYRNPLNPHQTWAGRGLKPKWLLALIKQGRRLEELAL